MTREIDPLEIYEKAVDDIILSKLAEADREVRGIGTDTTLEQMVEILRRANSLVSFVCGDDWEMYEEWRYRLIKSETGAYIIIQGQEIDVEEDIDFVDNEDD